MASHCVIDDPFDNIEWNEWEVFFYAEELRHGFKEGELVLLV